MIRHRIIFVLIIVVLIGLSILNVSKTAPQSSVLSMLDQLLQIHRLEGAHVGIAVRSLREGTSILNYNAQKYFCPASNEKLLLTLAALKELGPDYRFKTEIYVKNGAVIRDGILYSDVLIKGYGDPTLDASAIGEAFTHAPEFKGINKVAGSLLLDLSY
ncbi:D-alanyl-D-alanine carboxypeptidase, partial [Candidatus Aerophobetes bacterium]|nr:D-alanyl-D-alanine carboxypeptidase [Candidatus Aerophobetes bacterium]